MKKKQDAPAGSQHQGSKYINEAILGPLVPAYTLRNCPHKNDKMIVVLNHKVLA